MAVECCSLINAADTRGYDNFIKRESNAGTQKQTSYKSSSHAARAFEVLHNLRKDEVFCDIKLETDDGTIVYGHKVILASATPYFHSMFINFEESKKEHVNLREVDSTALKLLVDFIYTAQIMVTEDNVQNLLYAANLLQLKDVKEACCDFLQTQLNPTNCLGFKKLVSFYGCVELSSSFESYIQQNFSKVVEGDEFLCLPFEEVVELISCNELNVPSEEKVFECVINWMNHNSEGKEEVLLKLMEHVRLPLTSKEYLLSKVRQEPLLKNSFECSNYIIEALEFHLLKNEQTDFKLNTIRTQPRQPVGSHKIILVVGRGYGGERCLILEWYDLVNNKWQIGLKIKTHLEEPRTTILNDQTLFLFDNSSQRINDVFTFDLFSPSPCLKKTLTMLKKRREYGLGVLDNCIYAVGGYYGQDIVLKDGEVFNTSTQNWEMISEMTTRRYALGVGVLNNHLYAIGGCCQFTESLRSVERYCPTSGTWTPVAEMSHCRSHVGVGVLNGLIYAVGGYDANNANSSYYFSNSVEAFNPISNVWTLMSNMHKRRSNPRVVSFNGLLYVVGGDLETSVEIYNPKTNVWSMLSGEMNDIYTDTLTDAHIINKPSVFTNK